MLDEALSFPRAREGSTRDLLVGAALVLTSPLVVPALVLQGYLLEVMNAAARGRDRPPALGGWGGLLLGGLRGAVVWVVYGVVPLALVAGPPAAAWLTLGRDGILARPQEALLLGAVVVAMLAVLATLLALHLPAALVAVATQRRLLAAFQTGALWTVVRTKQYLVGVVLAAAVVALTAPVGLATAAIVVGLVLLFYAQVVAAYVLGRSVGGAAVTAIEPA